MSRTEGEFANCRQRQYVLREEDEYDGDDEFEIPARTQKVVKLRKRRQRKRVVSKRSKKSAKKRRKKTAHTQEMKETTTPHENGLQQATPQSKLEMQRASTENEMRLAQATPRSNREMTHAATPNEIMLQWTTPPTNRNMTPATMLNEMAIQIDRWMRPASNPETPPSEWEIQQTISSKIRGKTPMNGKIPIKKRGKTSQKEQADTDFTIKTRSKLSTLPTVADATFNFGNTLRPRRVKVPINYCEEELSDHLEDDKASGSTSENSQGLTQYLKYKRAYRREYRRLMIQDGVWKPDSHVINEAEHSKQDRIKFILRKKREAEAMSNDESDEDMAYETFEEMIQREIYEEILKQEIIRRVFQREINAFIQKERRDEMTKFEQNVDLIKQEPEPEMQEPDSENSERGDNE